LLKLKLIAAGIDGGYHPELLLLRIFQTFINA